MKVEVLSSGSKGNTTYIETKNAKILIDLGNTCKYVKEKLAKIEVDPSEIDAILITHTHVDHINGLKVFEKRYNTKVFMAPKMQPDLAFIENYEIIEDNYIKFKDLEINIIKTSHDAEDSRGYIINNEGNSIVYITDTGYINHKYFEILKNRNVYILESNHDVDLLNNGPYPFNLRQRILGDKGHLSNYDCAKYLSEFIGDNTKCIVLAHLSEENNTKELAYNTLKERLNENDQKVDKIIVAAQNEETEMIEI
jgi:phosphoribosyl 1,2-cyclic phosphodiesterase